MHPNEARIRDGYAAESRGNGKVLAALVAPDAEWYIPGTSPLAGTYRGLNEIFPFWRKVAELAPSGVNIEVLDVLANDAHAAVFVVMRSQRKGAKLEQRGVHIYELRDGLAVRGQFYYEDQRAYDEFWSA